MKRLIIIVLLAICSSAIFAQTPHQPKHKKAHKTVARAKYTCPMHPEVSSTKPGKCAKCGMKLVKAKSVVYTCPMHPEVTSNKPGKCPECGMDLEEKKGQNNSKAKG